MGLVMCQSLETFNKEVGEWSARMVHLFMGAGGLSGERHGAGRGKKHQEGHLHFRPNDTWHAEEKQPFLERVAGRVIGRQPGFV